MASNAIIDQFKRSSRERTSGDDPAAPKAALSPSLQEVRAINYRIQLFQLVEKLPAAQRRVIYERFVVQRNIREIASLLKKSEGAIKQLQFRALQTLRAQMEGRHA
jgi:RNA polymerase sigma-70 factor (ECF subfamily)